MWRRKVALHTSSHLTPTEAWRSPDSTISEGRRVSSGGTVRKLHAGLGGGPNLKSVRLTVEEKWYFTRVLTCSDLSGPTHNTVTMYARLAMSFFALSNALILQSYVLSW